MCMCMCMYMYTFNIHIYITLYMCDSGLAILIPYLLSRHQIWKNCKLRIFTGGSSRGIDRAKLRYIYHLYYGVNPLINTVYCMIFAYNHIYTCIDCNIIMICVPSNIFT